MAVTLHPMLHLPPSPSTVGKRNMDVEDALIWAFRDQAVVQEITRAMTAGTGPGTGSGTDIIARIMQLGTIVDTSGPGLHSIGSCRAPKDAVTIFEAVCCESAETTGLLSHHARTASTPDWPDMVSKRLVPWRNAAGRALINPADSESDVGKHTPLRLDHGPDLVDHGREVYALWHAGLCNVANALAGALDTITVTGPRRWGPGDGR